MRVLIIGGHGTIGQCVSERLASTHEIVIGGRTKGDVYIDIQETASIASALEKTGPLDAVICIAGEAKWADFYALDETDYYIGLKNKLMGQVNLTRLAIPHLNPGGRIILSTGILADRPVKMTASAAMVNGALHSFVQAAALDIKEEITLNVVSLGLVEDAYEKYKDYFPGHVPISMKQAADAYETVLYSAESGVVHRVY